MGPRKESAMTSLRGRAPAPILLILSCWAIGMLEGFALGSIGCASVVPAIPIEECDARCGTEAAEDLARAVALAACEELVAAEVHEAITIERCQLAAIVANSCRTLCR